MKTKLVRSQAIRETQSPPRLTPTPKSESGGGSSSDDASGDGHLRRSPPGGAQEPVVEIQITSGAWAEEIPLCTQTAPEEVAEGRQREEGGTAPRDELKYCVCGECPFDVCPDCSFKKRSCPAKQDSGIICSEDCVDCTQSTGTSERDTDNSERTTEVFCRCNYGRRKAANARAGNEADSNHDLTLGELVRFVKETLNKNNKDRATLLAIERDVMGLVTDPRRYAITFPATTSYNRMLIHRVSELFRLRHKLEQNSTVLVTKHGSNGGRVPCQDFKSWCVVEFPDHPCVTQPPAKYILKRSGNSLDSRSGTSSERALALANRSKSLEQREIEYRKVRTRIFTEEECGSEAWPWLGASVRLLTADDGKNKLLKVKSLEGDNQPNDRLMVSKSHSFGDPPPTRILSRQGDLASSSWRLSPSSSGYKTLSFRSTPSPTTHTPEPFVWCVSDVTAIPTGALIIHPQTGQPVTNSDGTVYYFDPSKPPPPVLPAPPLVQGNTSAGKTEPKSNPERRQRGRLEKQLSISRDEPSGEAEPVAGQQQQSTSERNNACEEARRSNWRHACSTCRPNETVNKTNQTYETAKNKSTNELKPKTNRTNDNHHTHKATNQKPTQALPYTNDNQTSQVPANETQASFVPTNEKPAPYAPANETQVSQANEMQAAYVTANERPPSYGVSANENQAVQMSSVDVGNQTTQFQQMQPDIGYEQYYAMDENYEQKTLDGQQYFYQPEVYQPVDGQTYHQGCSEMMMHEQNSSNEMVRDDPTAQQMYINQSKMYNGQHALPLESQPYCYEHYVQSPIYDEYAIQAQSQLAMQPACVVQQRGYPPMKQLDQRVTVAPTAYGQPATVILQPTPTAMHPCPIPQAPPQTWQAASWPTLMPHQGVQKPAFMTPELINYAPMHGKPHEAYPQQMYPVMPCYNFYPQFIPILSSYIHNGSQNAYQHRQKRTQRQDSELQNGGHNRNVSSCQSDTQNGGNQMSAATKEYEQKIQQVKEHFTKMGLEDRNMMQLKFQQRSQQRHPAGGGGVANYGRSGGAGYGRGVGERKVRVDQQPNRLSPAAQVLIDSFKGVNPSGSYGKMPNPYRDERTQDAIARIQSSLEVRSYTNRGRQVGGNGWIRRGGSHSMHPTFPPQQKQSTWRR